MQLNDQFSAACYDGDIMLAKKLLHENPQINISVRDEETFRYACADGHLEIAKWLLHVRPQIDISAKNEFSFRWACANGYLKTVKWLLKLRPQINISMSDDFVFKAGCFNGHLEVGKWIQTLKPYLYVINYTADGKYRSYYIRTKKEARWEQIKYLVWLSSSQSPNANCLLYKLPNDISRYIIQNFI